jgi:hypothetical protein
MGSHPSNSNGEPRRRIVVSHAEYGCDTGCCGHIILIDGEEVGDSFEFAHPYGQDPLEFAKQLVTKSLGAEHVADLDWDNCVVLED